jgi:carboxypeptidase Taq
MIYEKSPKACQKQEVAVMNEKTKQTAADFQNYMERINMFGQAMAIMSYDAETLAPDGGLEQRAKRSGFFELEIHSMVTSDTMKNFIEALTPHLAEMDDITRALYKSAKKSYDSEVKIPPALVEKYAELTEEAHDVWRKARKVNDFPKFAPYLERIIKMDKEKLEYRKDEIPQGGCPYDVLLDDYEDDMTVAKYDVFFSTLKETVVPLIKKVMASKKKIDTSFKNATVSIEDQRKISEFISKKIGYDLNCGVIGEAAHPMCMTFDSTDVRITTRYDENDFLSSLYSILHECGHAIYEQGVGADIAGSFLGDGTSMGIHESQSRFYENVIGRSLEFWEFITDELKTYLPQEFANVTPMMFFEATNESKPSLIRVEADELTYSLHVIIRYEIEKMLFGGDCKISDLPGIWNAKYQEYLGLTPPTDADGVMQDVHWSEGYFGYFPTYALGSAYAAQFLYYMKKDLNVNELIRKGEFVKITEWLREKIHTHGSKYTPEQLMQKSFGEQLNAKHYAEYLTEKYSKLYEL